MIVLSLLIYLNRMIILAFGVVMVAGHNLLDPIQASSLGNWDWLWGILHQPFWIAFNAKGAGMYVAYPLIPWIGVMALGYVFSGWLMQASQYFAKRCISLGILLLIGFIVLRLVNLYGDPSPWTPHERGLTYSFFSFINTEKYPPSLLFLLMTLGPSLMLMGWVQSKESKLLDFFKVFGRVPLFFYILHFPVIHLCAVIYFNLTIDAPIGWQMRGSSNFPLGYEPNLLLTYVAWFLVIFSFYFVCRWFMKIKQNNDVWYLKYI